jgi:hypothetical protein
MKLVFTIFLFFSIQSLTAQFTFQFEGNIPLEISGNNLARAWEGGINSAQFQKMDLNNDGEEDLIIFHRISSEITTYLAENDSFVWAPDYKHFFPPEITNWFILADYNCDGKKDIFTSVPQGITVYENISSGSLPEWQQAVNFLRFDSGANIQVNASDIPGIADIDGDGDLDILSYRFTTASTIDFYKNTGVENGNCSALTFERVTRRWGEFEECGCENFVFGGSCPIGGSANLDQDANDKEGLAHAGGKTITLFDADNDGDLDLITSDEFCQTLYFMTNNGNANNALMSSFVSYPTSSPAAFQIFPSAFIEDINFDGNKDLIISSNADGNVLNSIDFRNTSKNYINGSNTIADFSGNSSPFLQNEMLDLGENTYPAFMDFDNDGDFDLFIGTRGELSDQGFLASIYQFENVGSRFNPAFILVNSDFLSLKAKRLRNIKLQWIDIDGNGIQDLIYQSTTESNMTVLNFRISNGNLSFGADQNISITLSETDNAYFFDIDGNGALDLLRATSSGAVNLYLNQGSFNFADPINGFGSINSNFLNRNPSITIADLNGDGLTEIALLDNSGELKILSGTIGEGFAPSSTLNNVLKNSLTDSPTPTSLSNGAWLTAVDLFGNGKPTIVIGNNRGGIYFLKNESPLVGSEEDSPIALSTFPNPSTNSFFIRTNVDAVFHLYSVQGQQVFGDINLNAGVTKEILSQDLAAGIYLIRVANGIQKTTVKKIIIQK